MRPLRPTTIVAVAALAHVGAFLVLRPDRAPFTWEYGIIAGNLLAGHGLALDGATGPTPTAMQEPIYPLLLAAFLRVFPAPYACLVLFQSALWIAIAAAVGRLAERCLGASRDLVWLVVALWPPHVVYAQKYAPLVLRCGALTLVLLAAVAVLERPTRRRVVALGLALGAAALVRVTYEVLPLLLLVAFARAGARRLRALGAATALAALVVLPWPLRNLATMGAFIPGTTILGYSLVLGNHPGTTGALHDDSRDTVLASVPELFAGGELATDAALRREVRAFWRRYPARAAELYVSKLAWLWTWQPGVGFRYPAAFALPYQLLWCLTLPLALAGWLIARRSGAAHPHLPLGVVAALLCVYAVFWANLRLRFEGEPFLVAYAVVAVTAAWRHVAARRSAARLRSNT